MNSNANSDHYTWQQGPHSNMQWSKCFLSILNQHDTKFLRIKNKSTANSNVKRQSSKHNALVEGGYGLCNKFIWKKQTSKKNKSGKQYILKQGSVFTRTLERKCSVTLSKQAHHLHQISCLAQLADGKLSLICGSFLYLHGGSFLPWLSCLGLLKTMQTVTEMWPWCQIS